MRAQYLNTEIELRGKYLELFVLVVKPSAKYRNLPLTECQEWMRKNQAILAEVRKKGMKTIEITGSHPVPYGHVNQPISEYLIEAAEEGWHMYPRWSPWRDEIRVAISEFEKKYHGVDYDPGDIIPSPGAASAWSTIHYAILDWLDDTLAITPTHYRWSPTEFISLFNARVIESPSDENRGWQPNLDELRERITKKTKFIAMDHPCNPTGAIYSEKSLKGIVDVAGEYDIPIVSDEIYQLITFDGVKAKSVAEVAEDVPTIVIGGMSKLFLRTGWRVGYLAFHDQKNRLAEIKEVIRRYVSLYGHPLSCMPTPILAAATMAFRSYAKEVAEGSRKFVETLQHNRDFTLERLNEIDGVTVVKPQSGMFAFPYLHGEKEWKTDVEFMLQLAKEEGLTFIPGSVFGEPGSFHFRTHLLPSTEELGEAYDRLERFLKRHLS